MNRGKVLLQGTARDVSGVPGGRSWLCRRPAPAARWPGGPPRYATEHRGAPPGAELVEPTIEDGYLLLIGDEALAPCLMAAGEATRRDHA